jgi:putative peptide zinc metalloprotease protein
VDNLSTGGLIGFALALTCAKALHEFGHALTATRYGAGGPHGRGDGRAVAHALHRHQRKLEARQSAPAWPSPAPACSPSGPGRPATLAWSLRRTALRSALFFLATTSWVLTLAVNASPFMRFDGYFILADLLDMPNLHERAGISARTWLRRHLAGLDEPWPERLPPGQHRA